jgi:hypothetical protein
MMQDQEHLKYPIGKYTCPATISTAQIKVWIDDLAQFPAQLIEATAGLTDAELAIPYRNGGWTVKQIVHHLADSHINAYTRFHLTLTEDKPVIRPYFEDRWAELPDGKAGEIQLSIEIIKAIHARLVSLLVVLDPEQFLRTYIHPETKQEYTMGYLLGNYSWHGKHHLAHIALTKS